MLNGHLVVTVKNKGGITIVKSVSHFAFPIVLSYIQVARIQVMEMELKEKNVWKKKKGKMWK